MRIKEALALISRQSEEIAFLKQEIAELKRRLKIDSTTSRKPPSSDGLRKKPTSQSLRPRGQKPSGGQKGHKGTTLEQTASADFVVKHAALVCTQCAADLTQTPANDRVKRQVFDIPEPRVEVTEHEAEVKICPCCQHRNVASFPPGVVAYVQYGPRVKALAVYLSVQQLIPEDRLQTAFADLFGLAISTATLSGINQNFADGFALQMAQTREELKAAPVKHMDETGFRIGKKTCWLHVLCSASATVYRPAEKRGSLWEGVTGTIVHDHWKPYFTLEHVIHALCNAHHLRELKALEEIEKESWAKQMRRFLQLLSRLKEPLRHVRRACLGYDVLIARGLAFHEEKPALGGRKRRIGHNLLLRLKNFKSAVLRFLTDPTVTFTNNQAEQDLRMMKVKQKISGGFRTVLGAEIFCQIRGFLSTSRKQGLNLFDDITKALATQT